jgi:integrase
MKRAKSKKVNFTTRWIELLEPGDSREKFVDARVRGLGLVVQPSGVKSFYWTRKVGSRTEFVTLGQYPDLGVEGARDAAEERNHKLGEWKSKGFETENPFERRTGVTLDQLVELYVKNHVRPHAKDAAKGEKDLRYIVNKYMAPWRALKLAAIRQEDVAEFHVRAGKEHGHRTANHVVKTLRTLFNYAMAVKAWRGENPARGTRKGGIKFFPEPPRTRFIEPHELPRLLDAARRAPNPDVRDYIALALWTGARKSDILGMKWADLTLESSAWTIPDPKNRRPTTVALDSEAVEILKTRLRRRRGNNEWVFPGVGKSKHLTDLKGAWRKVLVAAGLDYPENPERRPTQHDMRRTLGAYLSAGGVGFPVIGAQLGHASIATTQRVYTPTTFAHVREALEGVTSAMRKLKAPKKPRLLPVAKRRKLAKGA